MVYFEGKQGKNRKGSMAEYDVIIVGAGPGGYVAGIRAAQLGLKTLVVEKAHLGGICLNWGCIPTKALLKSASLLEEMRQAESYGIQVEGVRPDLPAMIRRSREVAQHMNRGIAYLFKKNKVEWVEGEGYLLPGRRVRIQMKDGQEEIAAKHIIIATGARPRHLPIFPKEHERVLTYKEALVLDQLPQSIAIIGAGAIGVEFAYFYRALGSEVTLIEAMPRIVPLEDEEVSKELERAFRRSGIRVLADARVEEAQVGNSGIALKVHTKGKEEKIEAEYVLVAVGVQPNTENLGLEAIGIQRSERGHIQVNEWYQTNVEGYYAIGDVLATPALAHVASHEGIICVEKIAGEEVRPMDYRRVPACTYCQPEIASVGLTEAAARQQGYDVRVGKFPFTASGKARAEGHPQGFVKLVFDKKYGELLGVHMIGPHVTEMVAELVVAMNLETTEAEIFQSVHPHPTLSEAIMEAAGSALGHPIHI